MIIGVLGKKGSGKDTLADHIAQYGFRKIAFVDPLKDAIRILFGFNEEQLYGDQKEAVDTRWGTSPRRILQYLGTEVFRDSINNLIPHIGDNFWVNNAEMRIAKMRDEDPKVCISIADVRFPNEVAMIRRNGGIIVRVIRPSLENTDTHPSEKLMETIECEHELVNDGTLEQYHKLIEEWFDKLRSSTTE